MLEGSIVLLLGLLSGFLGGGIGGFWLLRRSGPVATAKGLQDLLRVRADWDAWRIGAEGMLESISELEEVIERKRRRVAARESVAARREGGLPPNPTKHELVQRARALGIPV